MGYGFTENSYKCYFVIGTLFATTVIIAVIIGTVIFSEPAITPMDVYQGKTTLKYTIIDGVKVDSCVVFK